MLVDAVALGATAARGRICRAFSATAAVPDATKASGICVTGCRPPWQMFGFVILRFSKGSAQLASWISFLWDWA